MAAWCVCPECFFFWRTKWYRDTCTTSQGPQYTPIMAPYPLSHSGDRSQAISLPLPVKAGSPLNSILPPLRLAGDGLHGRETSMALFQRYQRYRQITRSLGLDIRQFNARSILAAEPSRSIHSYTGGLPEISPLHILLLLDLILVCSCFHHRWPKILQVCAAPLISTHVLYLVPGTLEH